MTPIVALAFTLLVSAALWGRWVWEDAKAAFDGDPSTVSASDVLRHWRRGHGVWGYLGLGAPIFALFTIPTYLVLHLLLDLV